jgi:hypothetical protein
MQRDGRGILIASVVVLVVLVLFACVEDGTPSPVPCTQTVAALGTRAAGAEATLSAVETLVDQLAVACGGLWDDCCVPLTATAAAGPQPEATLTPLPTYTPRATHTPLPTYTARPSATAEPPFCRRCIVDDAVYGCPDDYVCELCDECYLLCVPAESPRAGCNFCAGILIP